MAQSTSMKAAQPCRPPVDPAVAWPVTLVESCLRMQRLHWDALAAWQRSFATFNEDFWEQWACRYAGGIPIDV